MYNVVFTQNNNKRRHHSVMYCTAEIMKTSLKGNIYFQAIHQNKTVIIFFQMKKDLNTQKWEVTCVPEKSLNNSYSKTEKLFCVFCPK